MQKEIWYQEVCGCCYCGYVFCRSMERTCTNSELQAREGPECCRQNLTVHSGGSLEDQNAKRKAKHKDCAHELRATILPSMS